MKRILLVAALAIGLGGCANIDALFGGNQSTKTITVNTVISACDAYQLALGDAALALKAHLLSDAVSAKIAAIRPTLNHICPPEGQMPNGPIEALVTVVTGTAQIIAAVKGGR